MTGITQQHLEAYARYEAVMERALTRGTELPPELLLEMQHIYDHGVATLSPQQQNAAMAAIRAMKLEVHQQLDAADHFNDTRDAAYFENEVTQGLSGMRPEQLAAALRGKPIPEASPRNRSYDKANVEAFAGKYSEHFTGKKQTFNQFQKTIDHYNDLKAQRGEAKANAYLKGKAGDKFPEFRAFIEHTNKEGVLERIGLAQRMGQEDNRDSVRHATDSEEMRAHLADAMMKTSKRDAQTRDYITKSDRIDKTYTDSENQSVQGDVARAFEQLELEEHTVDRENYAPAEYDGADLAASEEDLKSDDQPYFASEA